MNKKNQIVTALTFAITLSACTPATTITIEKYPDGSIVETIKTPPRVKKEVKKVIGIIMAGVAMKAVDDNIFQLAELATNYIIADKKIEKGVVDPSI
ncbi:MAG: Unknown protein [uncultured Thiotrichaceae bacterium]|uniref:Uncharacterized protein n=1 Tax=uncultured Thiotrichaceae bacterium TaxID=298394 RepID=A0A6S6S9D6_9GAMM|nr:MAG: Unknown protein [uncultured Thiotrichaceae bacterium]